MNPDGRYLVHAIDQKTPLGSSASFPYRGRSVGFVFWIARGPRMAGRAPACPVHARSWIAVAEMALFFWGMSSLALSLCSQWRERSALRFVWLPEARMLLPADQSRELLEHMDSVPLRYQDTMIGRRLRDVISDVHDRHAADRIDETLRDLAQRDSTSTHTSFSLVRVIIGILPVLGFLGSAVVAAITLTQISQTELEASLPQIIASLSIAFDPTVLAISLSLTLLLSMYVVERQAADLLTTVDESARQWLRHRFLVSVPENTPFLAAVHASSEQTMQFTRAIFQQQSELWSSATLRLHERLEQLTSERESSFVEVMRQLLEQWQMDTSLLEASHRKMDELHGRLGRIAELLVQRTGDERSLIAVQASLAENLKMLRETHSFDEALQSITAAVHLLTIRAHAVSNTPRDIKDNHREPRAA